ncbi:MAG: glycosyltransferase family 4 protein [Ruminococcus sp.]|nr:glycosyltransferase family 4 protein [Ruminococcus sp.]
MRTIAFVAPWFGENIPGGAEAELRGLTSHLHAAGVPLEILTTCVKDFASDWSRNFHRPGTYVTSDGITVRRFRADKRNRAAFDNMNRKLMHGAPLSSSEEEVFLSESVRSRALNDYISQHTGDHSLFVYIPYMFGTTYDGIRICPEKSVLIPCLHDEPYARLRAFRDLFPRTAGMVFNAAPEAELAEELYGLSASGTKTVVTGIGMDTDITADPEDFRRKFGITEPFILYAGRKDGGKNVGTLVRYFREYLLRHDTPLRLVLIGGGDIDLPPELVSSGRITDLGFVDKQDKFNALAAAELLCQPSLNESFSLVIMESWLCGRPVLVHAECPVTKGFVTECSGGLYFGDYFEFEGCVDYILRERDTAAAMGENGRNYVTGHFDWSAMVNKYTEFFRKLT